MPRKAPAVAGFDYTKGTPISMTAREWQAAYRACNRRAEYGETFYRSVVRPQSAERPRLLAEAYAYIPPASDQR